MILSKINIYQQINSITALAVLYTILYTNITQHCSLVNLYASCPYRLIDFVC